MSEAKSPSRYLLNGRLVTPPQAYRAMYSRYSLPQLIRERECLYLQLADNERFLRQANTWGGSLCWARVIGNPSLRLRIEQSQIVGWVHLAVIRAEIANRARFGGELFL